MIVALLAIGLAVLTLGAIAQGGSAEPVPAPVPTPVEPDSQPFYQQIPKDLCDRLRVTQVADMVDLRMAPGYERTSNYLTLQTHSYESCWFAGWAADGRFATEIQDFQPGGPVASQVYHEPADAEEAYDRYAASGEFEERAGREATPAKVARWWDGGVALEWVQELDPDDYDDFPGDFEISRIGVQYLLRHENLVIRAHLNALVPTEDTTRALAVLHDLQGMLINEVFDQLTRPTE